MACPGATVCELTDTGAHAVDYRMTDHFALTKRFLADPEAMLTAFLEE
ncbi:MAG: putative ATPase [Bradymonadia bacterium]|jgi:predicted ATPase